MAFGKIKNLWIYIIIILALLSVLLYYGIDFFKGLQCVQRSFGLLCPKSSTFLDALGIAGDIVFILGTVILIYLKPSKEFISKYKIIFYIVAGISLFNQFVINNEGGRNSSRMFIDLFLKSIGLVLIIILSKKSKDINR
ncbi:MAG TPA: hypothetical protein VJH95_00185 [Candidatus Nanoarchaeia archaeon]|nr:hypothetical protein [Candidatus Nanoarchaeia archaeon]